MFITKVEEKILPQLLSNKLFQIITKVLNQTSHLYITLVVLCIR